MTRQLPSSIDSERTVLGSVLLNNELVSELTAVSPDDFSLDSHRKIYDRMADLYHERQPINLVTVMEALRSKSQLTDIGGAVYLSGLTNGVPMRGSLAPFIRILREKAVLRRIINLGELVSAQAYEAAASPDEILTTLQDSTMRLSLESTASEKDIFVDVSEFCSKSDSQIDWLVEGLIERGSNGIAAADPKGAKSLTFAAGLAVSLALGIPWLGLQVRRRVRVAVVSREDNPSTTRRRINQVLRGKGSSIEEASGFLHINSKEQSPSLMLDNPREVSTLIRSLKKWGSEFVILDVFNKLHTQDENDNTKVRMVMNQIDRITAETGAQACVLHHWNKGDANQSLTRRIRGAGAIAGFAEWIAGIEMVDEKEQIRRISFETKVGEWLKPIHYQIQDDRERASISFKLMEMDA